MIKATIFALLLLLSCIIQVHASHYIQFKLRRSSVLFHDAGICAHDGTRIIFQDIGNFGSSVNNYGFHKDGYSANVNWKSKSVGVYNWDGWSGDFPTTFDNGYLAKWEGCWSTSSPNCNEFYNEAKRQCDDALLIM